MAHDSTDASSPPPEPAEGGGRITLLAKRLVVGGAIFFAVVMMGDLLIRILGLGPASYLPSRFEARGVPLTRIPNGPLVYQPNVTFASLYDPAGDARDYFGGNGRVEYSINARGYRGPERAISKPADSYRVVCLGDSFTFGEGVHEQDAWPMALQTLLRQKSAGTVEVINAGVQGYDTKDAAALYLLRFSEMKPDLIILGFVLNDATDSNETIRHNEATRKDLALSPLAKISKIAEIIERRRVADRRQQVFFDTTRRSFESPKWEECRQVLAGMARVASEDGARFLVVIFPIFWGLEGDYPFADIHRKIADACRAAGCEHIDLLDTYRGQDAESLWVHPTDQHPNEIAHRRAAEKIAVYLGR